MVSSSTKELRLADSTRAGACGFQFADTRGFQLCRFGTDHNVDGTAFALKHWCRRVRELYKSVDCHASYTWTYPTRDPYSTSVHRYKNKARLRQQALEAALTAGADYLLVSPEHHDCIFGMYVVFMQSLDVDCFLLNPKTLHTLMAQEK